MTTTSARPSANFSTRPPTLLLIPMLLIFKVSRLAPACPHINILSIPTTPSTPNTLVLLPPFTYARQTGGPSTMISLERNAGPKPGCLLPVHIPCSRTSILRLMVTCKADRFVREWRTMGLTPCPGTRGHILNQICQTSTMLPLL